MSRIIWKGAISFGLVNVPVALYPASQDVGIDFDWLDKRSMDPVGYKRINKRTGKEIGNENIVKGIKQDGGDYVVLSDDEIKAAYPKSTQTIAIEAFVKASDIAFTYLEKPYFTAPSGRGADRVYSLLREAMIDAGVIGIARVVMHSKEHLAALIPDGDALMLNTIRWASEMRARDEILLPPAGRSSAKLKEGELKMAHQLIGDMTTAWKPDDYADEFTSAIHALAARRVKSGDTEKMTSLEGDDATQPASNVVDLAELLKQSLATRKSPVNKAVKTSTARPTARKTVKAVKRAA